MDSEFYVILNSTLKEAVRQSLSRPRLAASDQILEEQLQVKGVTLWWPLSLALQLLFQAPALRGHGVPSAQCGARFEMMEAICLLKGPATSHM